MILRHVLCSVIMSACVAASYAQSTLSPPHSESKKEKSQEDKSKHGNEVRPAISKGSTIPSKPSADQAKKEKEQKAPDIGIAQSIGLSLEHLAWDSRVNLWLTGGLLLVAFFQLAYFFGQLRLMKRAILDTRKLIKATEDNATATMNTVAQMRDNSQQQLRAYVTVDADSPHFGTGGLRVRIRNHGSTPSKNTYIWTNIIAQIPETFEYPDQFPPVLVGYLVAPKQHCAVIVAPTVEMEFRETFFLYGHIDYTDIFGDRWRVDFCHEHQIGGGFFPSSKHNDEKYLGKDSAK